MNFQISRNSNGYYISTNFLNLFTDGKIRSWGDACHELTTDGAVKLVYFSTKEMAQKMIDSYNEIEKINLDMDWDKIIITKCNLFGTEVWYIYHDKPFRYLHKDGQWKSNLSSGEELTALFASKAKAQETINKYKPKLTLKDVKVGQEFKLKGDYKDDSWYTEWYTRVDSSNLKLEQPAAIVALRNNKLFWLIEEFKDKEVEVKNG